MKLASIIILIVLVGLSNAKPTKKSLTKPGKCPAPTGFGTCAFGCFGDMQCPGTDKCCSNGCGYNCQSIVKSSVKKCPDTSGLVGICVIFQDSCLTDDQCSSNQMCCQNGCGKRCVNV